MTKYKKARSATKGTRLFANKIDNRPSKGGWHKVLPNQHAPTLKVTSQGQHFKNFFLDSGMHINKEPNMFELQLYLI